MARVRVGTCGWQYRDWRPAFYPPSIPTGQWLRAYALTFDTVECDNAFYRLPEKDTFAKWAQAVPAGFAMAVKASRFLTHIKRLADPQEPVHRLMAHCEGLGDHLGPVLLQLPPNLRADADKLDQALAAFPAFARVAVELRHPSWFSSAIRGVLERRRAALVWADRHGRPVAPLWQTTDWGYVRLHEGFADPWPTYGDTALRTWLRRIDNTFTVQADVFFYFNNDPGAAAIRNARTLQRLATATARR